MLMAHRVYKMSMLKNPLFLAGIVTVIIIAVIVMLYRDVRGLRTSVIDVVREHNNAKTALDSHAKAIGDLRTVFIGDGGSYDDEEEISNASIEEMDHEMEDDFDDPEIKPDPSAKKKK